MADTNIVTLAVGSYNAIKNDNFRYNQSLVFDSKKVEDAVKFCYFERYKKKQATLKTQNTKYGDKKRKSF